jgi:hypothetical protein
MRHHFRCTRRVVVRGAVLALLGAALLGQGGAPVDRAAEPAPVAATEAAPPPEQVRALIELLGDPQVRNWLREQLAEPSQPAVGHPAPMEMGTMGIAERRLEAIRDQTHAMAAAIPRLPSALARRLGDARARPERGRNLLGDTAGWRLRRPRLRRPVALSGADRTGGGEAKAAPAVAPSRPSS